VERIDKKQLLMKDDLLQFNLTVLQLDYILNQKDDYIFNVDENGNIDCYNCMYCERCTGCNNCKGCEDCDRCENCNRCEKCVKCYECKNCENLFLQKKERRECYNVNE
jgi:hypothetical protein